MLQFRVAEPSDGAAVRAILPAPSWSERLAGYVSEARMHLGIDPSHGAVVLGVWGHPFFEHPFIHLIVVHQEHRRRGFGLEMTRHLRAEHAAEKVFVTTNESNVPMRTLLKSDGWIEAGAVGHLDPGDPEIFYVALPQ